MRIIRKYYFFNYIWVIMAIHLINISIDAPDKFSENIPEDLAINDIESISELILENVLLIDNAIAERDDHDNADGLSFEISKIILFAQSFPCFKTNQILLIKELNLFPIYKNWLFWQFFSDKVSPPPKA